jgi:hypothetical protein
MNGTQCLVTALALFVSILLGIGQYTGFYSIVKNQFVFHENGFPGMTVAFIKYDALHERATAWNQIRQHCAELDIDVADRSMVLLLHHDKDMSYPGVVIDAESETEPFLSTTVFDVVTLPARDALVSSELTYNGDFALSFAWHAAKSTMQSHASKCTTDHNQDHGHDHDRPLTTRYFIQNDILCPDMIDSVVLRFEENARTLHAFMVTHDSSLGPFSMWNHISSSTTPSVEQEI